SWPSAVLPTRLTEPIVPPVLSLIMAPGLRLAAVAGVPAAAPGAAGAAPADGAGAAAPWAAGAEGWAWAVEAVARGIAAPARRTRVMGNLGIVAWPPPTPGR